MPHATMHWECRQKSVDQGMPARPRDSLLVVYKYKCTSARINPCVKGICAWQVKASVQHAAVAGGQLSRVLRAPRKHLNAQRASQFWVCSEPSGFAAYLEKAQEARRCVWVLSWPKLTPSLPKACLNPVHAK